MWLLSTHPRQRSDVVGEVSSQRNYVVGEVSS